MDVNWDSVFNQPAEYNRNLETITKSKDKCLIVKSDGKIGYASRFSRWIESLKDYSLFKYFGLINRTNPEYVREYIFDFLKFGNTKGWNTSEKIKEITSNLPLFQNASALSLMTSLTPSDASSPAQNPPSFMQSMEKSALIGVETLTVTSPAIPPVKEEALHTPLQPEELANSVHTFTPISSPSPSLPEIPAEAPPLASSLKGRVKKELLKPKSSERSVKKALVLGFTLLLGAGSAAVAYATGTVHCVSYYQQPALGDQFEAVETAICQTERQGWANLNVIQASEFGVGVSKLHPNLLNNAEFMNKLVMENSNVGTVREAIKLLGDDIRNDPTKLMSFLTSSYWYSRYLYPNLFAGHLDLFERIPYKGDPHLCMEVIEMYPKKLLVSFYENLEPNLQTDPSIAARLIDFAADSQFVAMLCKKFPGSEEVALAAYGRDPKAYEEKFRFLFNSEVQNSKELQRQMPEAKKLRKLESYSLGDSPAWPPLNTPMSNLEKT